MYHLTSLGNPKKGRIAMKYTCRVNSLLIACLTVMILMGLAGCSNKMNDVIIGEFSWRGKPTAPITVLYTVPAKTVIGESAEVILEFRTLVDVDGLRLKLTAGEGLSITPKKFEVDYGNQPANSSFSETVTVIPESEGMLYMNVFIYGTFHGKRMVRTGAVPIMVGSDKRRMLKKPDKVTTDSEGHKIIIMPAEEKNK